MDQSYREQYQKKWHQKNKERRLKQFKERKKEIQEWFREFKSSLKCEECGFSHPAVIDFHHEDSGKKDDSVSSLVARKCCKKRILEEVKKCKTLCSNCHRILHDKERTGA